MGETEPEELCRCGPASQVSHCGLPWGSILAVTSLCCAESWAAQTWWDPSSAMRAFAPGWVAELGVRRWVADPARYLAWNSVPSQHPGNSWACVWWQVQRWWVGDPNCFPQTWLSEWRKWLLQ